MTRLPDTATLSLIKDFEGLRLTAYLDPGGICTIGWGHCGPDVSLDMKIALAQAENLFAEDIRIASEAVCRAVTVPLNDHEFGALVSFTFNLGAGRLKNSTLLKFLNDERRLPAADQFLVWDHGDRRDPNSGITTKIQISGLTRRRVIERSLFLKPVNETMTDQFPLRQTSTTISPPPPLVPQALENHAAYQSSLVGLLPNTKVVATSAGSLAGGLVVSWGLSLALLALGIPVPPGVLEAAGVAIGSAIGGAVGYFTPASHRDLLQHAPATLAALKDAAP